MKNFDRYKLDRAKNIALCTIITIILGFIIGALSLGITGYNPMDAFSIMYTKVAENFGQVIGKATPLIFTGLAIAIPYSVGLINLGAEGQMIAGSFVGALVGAYVPGLPPVIHITLCILAGSLTGLLFALFCGWMKFKLGASEVVTSVMLNSVILFICEYLANGPLNGVPSQPQTKIVLDSARIGKFNSTDNWTYAIFIALAFAVATWIFVRKSVTGYKIRASGLNPMASRYKGINVTVASLLAMAIGGALAGAGGVCEALSVRYSYYHGALTNYGYTGMGVALIAWSNPLAIIPSAGFLAAIRVGGLALDRQTDIPSQFVWILQGSMIMILGARGIMDKLSEFGNLIRNRFIRVKKRSAELEE